MKRGKAHPAHQGQALKHPQPNQTNILLISTPGGGFLRERSKEKKELQKLKIKSK